MTIQRYEQGSVGMRRDDDGAWCEYEEVQNEINTLKSLIIKYVDVDTVYPNDYNAVQDIFLEYYKEEDYDIDE